jgi:1-deoxy-D-xylulose-5-phosphate reductoisomerase
MKTLTILGSTGSIGTSTLDVIRRNREDYRIHALVAGQNTDLLVRQIQEFRPSVVVVATESALRSLTLRLAEAGIPKSNWPELFSGLGGRVAAAIEPGVDFVMSAIVGVSGLEATFEAVKHHKTVGLANKEVLVACGELVMKAARETGSELIPVDSEHNGAHQCLRGGRRDEVLRLMLTASGGPFRKTPRERLAEVTPRDALNHPTWKMGRRITIDSATMMNKGFEVIEACWLFGFSPREVGVVVHPQSSVHAMVEYRDGSILAQISTTDMRMPIQYALTYPRRDSAPVPRMDWATARVWEFEPPDMDKFRLLALAYQAQEGGGTSTCTLNAADEVAVAAFLQEQIPFPAIAEIVEETLNRLPPRKAGSVGEILEIDRESRAVAGEVVRARSLQPK